MSTPRQHRESASSLPAKKARVQATHCR